jgi:hypothetical protein
MIEKYFGSIVTGLNEYEMAKMDFQGAISEDDEAVFDLVVAIVVGLCKCNRADSRIETPGR